MHLHLLHGNHSFLRLQAKKEAIRNYRLSKNENVNFLKVSSEENAEDLNSVKQKLASNSLFAAEELLVISFSASVRVSQRKKKDFWGADIVLPYLSKLPSNLSLLLDVSIKLPAASKLLAGVKKNNGSVQLFELPSAKNRGSLQSAIRDFLSENKIEIDSSLVYRLIEQGQGDWWFVFSALEQAVLLLNALGKKRDDDYIAQLWNIPEEKNIFRLFDAIGNGNQKEAFSLLYANTGKDGARADTEVETVLGFTSLMARQLRQMLAVKEGMNLVEAQKSFQVPGFAYGKLKCQVVGFDTGLLVNTYRKLTEVQEKAKSGLWSPLSLVDFFVIYLISHRRDNTYLPAR